jgi:hypothetical protein
MTAMMMYLYKTSADKLLEECRASEEVASG